MTAAPDPPTPEPEERTSDRDRPIGPALATTGRLAIVDVPDSLHGRVMHRAASLDGHRPAIVWLTPSLTLPEDLDALTGVATVALPLSVRGAAPTDRFTSRVIDAIRRLERRGIRAFVAAGTRRENLLARAGTAVRAGDVPGSASTSEACVRAAARAAASFTPTPAE